MCHLFGEGNDLSREGDWTKSIEMYTEALNIAEYADSEDICIPSSLLEKLYANRAAAYLTIVPVSPRGPSERQSCDPSPRHILILKAIWSFHFTALLI